MNFLTDGSSQIYTDNMLIVDELLPGLELTTRQIFEEAELIEGDRFFGEGGAIAGSARCELYFQAYGVAHLWYDTGRWGYCFIF